MGKFSDAERLLGEVFDGSDKIIPEVFERVRLTRRLHIRLDGNEFDARRFRVEVWHAIQHLDRRIEDEAREAKDHVHRSESLRKRKGKHRQSVCESEQVNAHKEALATLVASKKKLRQLLAREKTLFFALVEREGFRKRAGGSETGHHGTVAHR